MSLFLERVFARVQWPANLVRIRSDTYCLLDASAYGYGGYVARWKLALMCHMAIGQRKRDEFYLEKIEGCVCCFDGIYIQAHSQGGVRSNPLLLYEYTFIPSEPRFPLNVLPRMYRLAQILKITLLTTKTSLFLPLGTHFFPSFSVVNLVGVTK